MTIKCKRCGHAHYDHWGKNGGCLVNRCSCRNCQCVGCIDIHKGWKDNPLSDWHSRKIMIGTQTFKEYKKKSNRIECMYWKGYVEAHRKFIEIEKDGLEPNYQGYINKFTPQVNSMLENKRNLDAVGVGKMMQLLGVVNAARESLIKMKADRYGLVRSKR